MPPPFKVELKSHDPKWASKAEDEGQALAARMGACLLNVHHIGSTAIPDIHAKPILDLMPVVTSLAELDERKPHIETLGYEWWGEFGLPGRRYYTKSDPDTGRRLVQLHCYARGSPEITRHLAFREYLRGHPEVARTIARRSDARHGILMIPTLTATAKADGSKQSKPKRSNGFPASSRIGERPHSRPSSISLSAVHPGRNN
ncbi:MULTISPECIES: GrpB family protein [unclassified Bradyrhizobium]|uniref:GrpB family protein n=1 Tax=unclassified Bradyrhizobium TaxID=2631580 RepID=UPI00201311BE|nr:MULTISPECIES: GrpB family protein [unclassified Bradyrhizobium]